MIDFSKIEQYRENNRIEAKKISSTGWAAAPR